MTSKVLSAAVAAALLVTLGCEQGTVNDQATAPTTEDRLGPDTVAAADGRTIPESLYRFYALNSMQTPADELPPEERETVINNLVNVTLLAEEAEKRGLDRGRTIAAELELRKLQVLAAAMMERFVEENPPSEAELQAEYETVLPQLVLTEHKARHILVESEEMANALIEQLQEGADFAELADEHSTDSGSEGGDLGWIIADPSVVVAPFADAVAELEVGTFSSQPVQTEYGWHVILVEDRRDADPPSFEVIRQELSNRVAQRKLESFIEDLRGGTPAGGEG